MKKIWFFLSIILIVLIGLFLYLSLQTNHVCFKNHCFTVELAKTPTEREKGLMFRNELDQDRGMLFIYPKEGKYDFWMKNTLIPLDMIWIDKTKKVVSMSRNNQPCLVNECLIISSSVDAQYILEINGGLVDKLGIREGDYCTINYNFGAIMLK